MEAKAIENETGSAVGTSVYNLICRYSVMDITITDQGNLYLNCNVHLHLISKFSNVFHFNEYIYPFCTHTVCIKFVHKLFINWGVVNYWQHYKKWF